MFIDTLKEKAKLNKKRIVLTECDDNRILEAIKIVIKEELADIIVIGKNINIENTLLMFDYESDHSLHWNKEVALK